MASMTRSSGGSTRPNWWSRASASAATNGAGGSGGGYGGTSSASTWARASTRLGALGALGTDAVADEEPRTDADGFSKCDAGCWKRLAVLCKKTCVDPESTHFSPLDSPRRSGARKLAKKIQQNDLNWIYYSG